MMSISFTIILFIFNIGVGVILIETIVHWSTHKSMTIESTTSYSRGTFKQFLKKFYDTEWQRDKNWEESFFNNLTPNKTRIHASIISFDGHGMVLDFISYIKYEI